MNKELANHLLNKLINAPFIDVGAGIVQAVEYSDTQYSDKNEGRVFVKRMPVAEMAVIKGDTGCTLDNVEKDLVPNSSKRGIFYFEDAGVQPLGFKGSKMMYRSRLLLVCWINRQLAFGEKYALVSGRCIQWFINQLVGKNPYNSDIFLGLTIKANRILEQNKSIFSKYTYDEKVLQYLRPPFEYFAIEFVCEYGVSNCLPTIEDSTFVEDCTPK